MMAVTVRRTKDEPGTSAGLGHMDDARLDWHFSNWQAWMHSGHGVGAPRSSPGLTSGGGQSNFDDMADASERRVAVVCNTLIDDLPPAQGMAIYHRYLHAVYTFHRSNMETYLYLAREAIRAGLDRRGIA